MNEIRYLLAHSLSFALALGGCADVNGTASTWDGNRDTPENPSHDGPDEEDETDEATGPDEVVDPEEPEKPDNTGDPPPETGGEPQRGARIPWTTYEAEDMETNGQVLGPQYDPHRVETEASGRRCVRLVDTGHYVQFTALAAANSLVLRLSVPDAPQGRGIDATLSLLVDGRFIQKLHVTSRYSWLYGRYPWTNDPGSGSPRNFFDEVRLLGLQINAGDVIRLEKMSDDLAPGAFPKRVQHKSLATRCKC